MTLKVRYFWFTEWAEPRDLLALHAPEAEHIWTGPDDYGYWRALAREWDNPEDDLVVIEQDVGIHGSVIPEFTSCPEPWCAFGFPVGGITYRGLGCTRFSAELRRKVTVQDIMCPMPHCDKSQCDGAYCMSPSPGGGACHNRHKGCFACGAFCFRHLDGPICDALRIVAGLEEPHHHDPPVRHLHYE